ncbi:MAG: phosphate ABC transporter substrate-binding protein PstS [Acidimicrobiia bacterium]|jgi:phosphate transport system substrate-binding protein
MQRRHRVTRLFTAAAVAAGLVATVGIAPAGAQRPEAKELPATTINGSGATFPQGMIDTCREAFSEVQPNLTVNYPNPGGGSGKGRQEFADQVTAWGASDAPYSSTDLTKIKGGPFLYVPYVTAPITVSYNLSSVKKPLKFSPATIAKLFQGDITSWDDPAIAADNPGVKLPATKITIAHRSDGSGTTENFTKYLVKAAGSIWKLGSGATVPWPADSQGGNGNSGVSAIVKGTDGAIGYVDLSDAKATGLTFGSVQNASGKFVLPSLPASTAALEGVALAADGLYDPLNSPNPAAYPISAPTWLLVYQKYSNSSTANAVKAWAEYLVTGCQKLAKSVDYAPIPKSWAKQTLSRIEAGVS